MGPEVRIPWRYSGCRSSWRMSGVRTSSRLVTHRCRSCRISSELCPTRFETEFYGGDENEGVRRS
jgi:hypothetical protein